jgi:hypothetical protein
MLTIAAYVLIIMLHVHAFKMLHFYLGQWAKPMYLATVLFNLIIFVVRPVLFTPYAFLVLVTTFQQYHCQ